MEEQIEVVPQEVGAVLLADNSNHINEVPDEVAKAMPGDYKKDFFRQKEIAREAKKREEDLLSKVKEYEEKEAERLGNHKKIIETLKEENAKLKGDLTAKEKRDQLAAFDSALISKATDLGFTKPDRIKSFLSDDDKKILVLDDDLKIDEYGLNKAFENVKKEWPDLFRPKNVKFADGVPKTNLNEAPKKAASQMTTEERMAELKRLRTTNK